MGLISSSFGFKNQLNAPLAARERRSSSVVDYADLVSGSMECNDNSKVSFDPQVQVIYIPTAAEYKLANLADCLWWKQSELNDFRNSAACEIEFMMSTIPELLRRKPSLKMLDEQKLN